MLGKITLHYKTVYENALKLRTESSICVQKKGTEEEIKIVEKEDKNMISNSNFQRKSLHIKIYGELLRDPKRSRSLQIGKGYHLDSILIIHKFRNPDH